MEAFFSFLEKSSGLATHYSLMISRYEVLLNKRYLLREAVINRPE
jgi:hypothetical protein